MAAPSRYYESLKSLLPRGRFWNFSIDSKIGRILNGIATAVERIDQFYGSVREEFEVQTATDMTIAEWERDHGVDTQEAITNNLTLQQRRDQVIAIQTQQLLASFDIIRQQLAAINVTATIQKFKPTYSGVVRAGDPLRSVNLLTRFYLNNFTHNGDSLPRLILLIIELTFVSPFGETNPDDRLVIQPDSRIDIEFFLFGSSRAFIFRSLNQQELIIEFNNPTQVSFMATGILEDSVINALEGGTLTSGIGSGGRIISGFSAGSNVLSNQLDALLDATQTVAITQEQSSTPVFPLDVLMEIDSVLDTIIPAYADWYLNTT